MNSYKVSVTGTDTVKLVNYQYAKSVITVTGDLGAGSAKLVFKVGDSFIDVPDGSLTVGSVIELTHGKGNFPYVEATGVTSITVVSYGVE